jgi:hypothetical protein
MRALRQHRGETGGREERSDARRIFSAGLSRLAGSRETREKAAMRSSSTILAVSLAATVCGACGGAAPPPTEAPKPESSAAADAGAKPAARDGVASKAAAVDALVTDESKKGTCDEGHKAALEKLLADAEANLSKQGLQLVAKRVVALGSSAKSIEMAVSGRGTEVHVLAFGVRDVSLDVLVGSAAATTLRSPFQRSATSGPLAIELPKIGTIDELQTDSRQVTIKPGQPIVVKVSGQGCAALVSFLKP